MAIAIFFASIITSVTGMAGGLLMFAAMNIFIPVRPLIAIHGVVQVFNNAARTWYLFHELDWPKCLYFSVGAVLGSVATTLFIVSYVNEFWPLLMLIMLVIYTLFKPKSMPAITISDKQFFGVGIATGTIGMLVGVVDPILGVFFLRDDMSKEAIIANKSLMQSVTHFCKIPAFIFLGFSFLEHLELIVLLGLAGVMGSKVGVMLLQRMKTSLFFILMKIGLFIALLKMCMQLYSYI